MKLLFDLSLAKAELEKERQLRIQIEQQLTETNVITEQVKLPLRMEQSITSDVPS